MYMEILLEKVSYMHIRLVYWFLPKISITGIYAFTNFGAASFGSWESTVAAMLAGASIAAV
jgi:hypothetical protein